MDEKIKNPRGWRHILSYIRKYFFSGLATILPLFISVYVIILTVRFFDRLVGKYINSFFLKSYGFAIPGLGFFVTILAVVIIGFISAHFIGKAWVGLLEKIFLKIPFIASIYPSAKRLSDFLFRESKGGRFKKVVLVEYPYQGSYSVGFVTNEKLGLSGEKAKEELISVFVPFPPSPFSGFTLLVTKDKLVELDISIDQAIKFIVSGGIIPFSDTCA